ncbi:MAG: hypothetical protein JSV40_03670 [Deltaproteobacteria bacterium]|nr:MAG: hypothetical protein JSV40_03670 [Deltaproteobacteria bacterium]
MENIIYGVMGAVGICMALFFVGTIIGLGKQGFVRLAKSKRSRWPHKV